MSTIRCCIVVLITMVTSHVVFITMATITCYLDNHGDITCCLSQFITVYLGWNWLALISLALCWLSSWYTSVACYILNIQVHTDLVFLYIRICWEKLTALLTISAQCGLDKRCKSLGGARSKALKNGTGWSVRCSQMTTKSIHLLCKARSSFTNLWMRWRTNKWQFGKSVQSS